MICERCYTDKNRLSSVMDLDNKESFFVCFKCLLFNINFKEFFNYVFEQSKNKNNKYSLKSKQNKTFLLLIKLKFVDNENLNLFALNRFLNECKIDVVYNFNVRYLISVLQESIISILDKNGVI